MAVGRLFFSFKNGHVPMWKETRLVSHTEFEKGDKVYFMEVESHLTVDQQNIYNVHTFKSKPNSLKYSDVYQRKSIPINVTTYNSLESLRVEGVGALLDLIATRGKKTDTNQCYE